MWYEKSFRRHLCDMHIDDWNAEFLSKLDPEQYVNNLKRANVTSAMLYFQSHVGLCYFPTKTGKMHAAFEGREDTMRRVVDLCHQNGISVTGYYSLIYNTVEHDRHPDWRLIYPNGFSQREGGAHNAKVEFSSENAAGRYGMCCPNNIEYRAFVKAQIEEMAEYFPDVEGMFYDMLFWPDLCYCDKCRARWDREVGGELSRIPAPHDERWVLHMKKRREWMGEFAQWVTDLSKSLWKKPISVEHNVAVAVLKNDYSGNGKEVVNACDYAGGDLYGNIYSQSFTCKFYRAISKNQPFEYMFSRCAPRLAMHTQIKSRDIMRSAMFTTAANHGATLIIDAIDPVGTLDGRVYEQIGDVFSELEPHEPYLVGEPCADVGVYYSLESKCDRYKDGFTNYNGAKIATETFVGKHILCGITGDYAPLDKFKLVVAPTLRKEDSHDFDRLIKYVENGGNLYFSGGDCAELLDAFFGAKTVHRTDENVVYIAPCEKIADCFYNFNQNYPLNFESTAPIVEGIDPEYVVAKLTLPYTSRKDTKFASIHSDPPGVKTEYPAIAARKFGKGRVLWSALPIETREIYDYRDIFVNLLKSELGLCPTVTTDAEDDVEITAFEQEDGSIIMHTVLLNSKRNARKVYPFTVSFKTKKAPSSLVCLPEGKPLKSEYDGERVTFLVDDLDIFKTFRINF